MENVEKNLEQKEAKVEVKAKDFKIEEVSEMPMALRQWETHPV
ncbi:hypothetical protein [Virgibacillus dokdonensis]|nr:hypothetical protein [Virgibacillus dokdonensis]